MLSKLLALSCLALALACTAPTWGTKNAAAFNPTTGQVFATFINIVVPDIGTFETPIQFRLIQNTNLAIYSAMSAYEPTALDHFARVSVSNARRICTTGPDAAKHRQVTLAYTLIFGCRNFFPKVVAQLEAAYLPWGIDASVCDAPGSCTTLSTPWGLAKTLANEAWAYSTTDGWNADGSLSHTYFKIPYQDWRSDPYTPRNNPWTLQHRKNWQPLLENNGRGYLFNQEHVTPHIGNTARSIFFRDEEICARVAPKPHYKLDDEIEDTFARLAALNDNKKMDIELFDSKVNSFLPLMAQWYLRAGPGRSLDDWGFIQVDSLVISGLYESVIVVWKEKVNYDLVRPPSYARSEYADVDISSWGGPGLGTQTMKGRDFRSWIRTMPHSEYPSGSSCACGVFEASMRNWSGYDVVAPYLTPQAPLLFTQPDGSPLPAGSSKTEPGFVPAAPWTGVFPSWSDLAARCGQSRLDGGMHFPAAVTHGRTLCYDIGTKLSVIFRDLNLGKVPSYVVNINAPLPDDVRC